jgi:hypothetical protein
MYSLYKTDKKIKPFIDTGAYTAYKKIPFKRLKIERGEAIGIKMV